MQPVIPITLLRLVVLLSLTKHSRNPLFDHSSSDNEFSSPALGSMVALLCTLRTAGFAAWTASWLIY